jgi:signal transduction histidine kinase
MKIRSQILLLLLLIVAVFIGGVSMIKHEEMARVAELTDQNALDLNVSFDHFLRERGRSLQLFVSPEFRDWDELVTAVENRDAMALQPLLDDAALRAYEANAVWILGPDFAQLHARNNVPAKALSDPQFTVNLYPRLCAAAPGGCHYFLMTAEGLMEIRGIALHPGWLAAADAAKASPIGYFFAGRLLTNRDAAEMGSISGNEVRLITSPDSSWADRQQAQAGVITFQRDLKGPDGRTVAWLGVRHVTRVIAAFQQATDWLSLLLILFAATVLILLAAALHVLVSKPLHVITRSLHTRDLAPLESLSGRRSEIGELAGLITEFYSQRDQLVKQMDERRAVEHALEESEEKLRQAQKMEAIGRLAGGVAHDFNNLLTAIVGYANLLSTKVDADPETRRQATIILQAGQQASGLTQQLLAFGRKQMLQPQVIDANVLVGSMERLLRRIIGENIDIRTEFQAMHACVKADPHQVEQVVLNLAVNARDAMPRGGKLLLKTSNQTLRDGEITDVAAGEYVVLEVSDTGEGMDKRTIERIFEPFFTTKVSGKGTGLGLATVYGVVRQSGGGITVESQPGRGSTFRAFFPKSKEPIQPLATPVSAAEPSAGGGTILVVDDQKMVANLVGDVLKKDGYRVLIAGGPSEAIGHFRKNQIDLLITDIIMPRIDGRTLAEMVQARHERVKILYISGYAEPDSDGQPTEVRETQVLLKPFTPEVLSRTVREILGVAS